MQMNKTIIFNDKNTCRDDLHSGFLLVLPDGNGFSIQILGSNQMRLAEIDKFTP